MEKENTNFIINKPHGLYCPSADFWIDPKKPVKKALITHAHFDHVCFGCDEYICSIETGIILQERLNRNLNINMHHYNENFKINGINISFHPSGHILGSSQIKIKNDSETWLITGDFKLEDDQTCMKYEEIKTDYLICESTFGLPIFNWDPSQEIINNISNWLKDSPNLISILFCYSLGKSQRILNELNNKEISRVYCHNNIEKMNNIYRSIGVNLIETKKFNKSINLNNLKGCLIMLPPILNNSNFLKNFKSYQTGFASGWMSIRALKNRSGYDKGFPISDHADWKGLIKTIKNSEAKKIFLNHGDGEHLSKFLKDKDDTAIEMMPKVI